MGNMGDAMRIINEKSNLPAICGRVCPHEKQCQGHCVLYAKGKGIQIGKLERFVADFDTEMNLIREKLPQKTRGKIAVIGSGPAGLTVAGDLARQGFNVTIFESQSEAGGVLMYGIPEYRLPKAVVTKEVKKIEALGVNFVLNCLVGKDITVDQMFEQGYDAISSVQVRHYRNHWMCRATNSVASSSLLICSTWQASLTRTSLTAMPYL